MFKRTIKCKTSDETIDFGDIKIRYGIKEYVDVYGNHKGYGGMFLYVIKNPGEKND